MDEVPSKQTATPTPSAGTPARIMTLDGVDLAYGTNVIVRDVNLVAYRGVCLGILGPNGAGKTTLLRAMLGILKPVKGTIRWGIHNGQPIRIGYVPQKERLDPSYPLTVQEVVRMGVFGDRPWSPWLTPAQRQRIHQALEQVRMEHFTWRLFAECSGGQRQRVLIARALASAPNVLIFDEPTTGIDPLSQREVVQLLKELRQNQRMTMFLITQHFGHLEQLFEEVAWVHAGQVVVGPASEFLSDAYISKAFGKD